MSRNRPSLIAGLDLPKTAASAAAPAPEATVEPPVPSPAPKTAAKPGADMMHTTLYLPKGAHQKLREIAFTTDRKLHDLLIEGIDEVLRRHGHPPVATFKAKEPS